jgi:hypothetical protein
MRVAEDRARWREIGDVYVQQWADDDDDDDEAIISVELFVSLKYS